MQKGRDFKCRMICGIQKLYACYSSDTNHTHNVLIYAMHAHGADGCIKYLELSVTRCIRFFVQRLCGSCWIELVKSWLEGVWRAVINEKITSYAVFVNIPMDLVALDCSSTESNGKDLKWPCLHAIRSYKDIVVDTGLVARLSPQSGDRREPAGATANVTFAL